MPRAWTLDALARRLGAELHPPSAASRLIRGVATPVDATPNDIAPVFGSRARGDVERSSAGAFMVAAEGPHARPQLVVSEPRGALAELIELFAPAPPRRRGVHRSSVVERGASIAASAWVGPFSYVAAGAVIGADCQLLSHVHVGAEVVLGPGCRLGPHSAVLEGCELGEGCVLDAGAVVGTEGFGFAPGRGELRRLRSQAAVRLGPGVEVGAQSCVDRGTLADTKVGASVKIDNLVQIAHNVSLGEGALLCAQAGLAGSVKVGAGAMLGGQAGVADGVEVGPGARVAAQAGVIADVPGGHTVAGFPAQPRAQWARQAALLAKLDGYRRRLEALEELLEARDEMEE